ncbi:MATE family efflux transporter [soil metagenome]
MNLFQNFFSLRKEANDISKLAYPLAITQIAQVAIIVTNVLMMGLLETKSLAAGGLAITIFSLLRAFGNGVISCISNLIAYESGRQTCSEDIGNITKAGFIIALILGLIFYLISWFIKPLLIWTGQDSTIIPLTTEYLHISLIGMVPCLWFLVLRNFTVGLHRPGKLMIFTLISVVLNILFNFIFMFGYFGFPKLGLMGIAWSSNLVFVCSFLMFAISLAKNPTYASYKLFHRIIICPFKNLLDVCKTGLPNGITYASESGFFTVIALLMGKLGPTALATNTIVTQCIYITYMLSVAISHATSMYIGKAYGANDYYSIRRYAYTALIIGFICMGTAGIIFWLFNYQIIYLFIGKESSLNSGIFALGTQLLCVAAIFQIFDGWQNISLGILRGFKAMHKSMFISLFGYWVIGLSLAYLLGFHLQQGAIGIWRGLACGLAVTAVLYIISFEIIYRTRYRSFTINQKINAAEDNTNNISVILPSAG